MYKQASRVKLRFNTSVGILTVEQLWKADTEVVISLEEDLQQQLEQVGKTSRRNSKVKTKEVEELELRLSIVSDVLDTKEKEGKELQSAGEVKQHNQKILSLIAEKQEEGLKNMSVEDLEKLLK